ncbi:MAG: PIN domain-containing protein [Nocardioidaceae bacterium]|nr:MAG: PIN domain-containing protein [Nocardioidaceae bacterium]
MSPTTETVVVVDTMVVGWLINHDPRDLKDTYRALIGDASIVLALQTLGEMRAGTLESNWGEFRTRRLQRALADFEIARPDEATADAYARLRADCRRIGHGLHDKKHDGDRWIAATAVRLGVPLVSHDRIFLNVPGLRIITAHSH